MPFAAFVEALRRGRRSEGGVPGVPYLSHQNDSLREEFPGLAADVPKALDIATEA